MYKPRPRPVQLRENRSERRLNGLNKSFAISSWMRAPRLRTWMMVRFDHVRLAYRCRCAAKLSAGTWERIRQIFVRVLSSAAILWSFYGVRAK